MATFTPELDNYIGKDGNQKIQIRITHERKLKRVGIDFAIAEKFWNPEKREVRKTHPQAAQINSLIKSKILELEQQYLKDSTLNRPVTAKSLQNKIKKQVNGDSFLDYARERVTRMPSSHTRKSQTSVLDKLEAYLKDGDLLFSEVTFEFLTEYKNYLSKKLGNNANTVHANFKTLKSAYNEAVEGGHYEYEKVSPFVRVKVKKAKSSRTRLKEPEIELIENLELKSGKMISHSRNAFLFAYYLQGIRVSDLLQLKWSAVKGDKLTYAASKTGKSRPRIIISKAKVILDEYRFIGMKPSDYIFPFLRQKKQKDYSEDDWRALLDSTNANIRNHLMDIAEMINIPKLSMHVARHSFADIAKRKTGNVYLVSDAMDHGTIQTTENYFSSAESEENDAFAISVLGK